MTQGKYERRGVSASKDDVHAAIKNMDKGLFPGAFCKILPDYLAGSDAHCTIIHSDGAGTKSSLAYAYYKETGDLTVWKGIAQDAIVMNLDDMLCAGATGPFLMSSTIGRNKNLVGGEVISALINGSQQFIDSLQDYGVDIRFGGGETADLGDLVRTVVVDSTMTARMRRDEVIDNTKMQLGDVIVGLASFGQTNYEDSYNGGMGSNGLTSARHDVFSKEIGEKYPECFDPLLPSEVVFTGSRTLKDPIAGTGLDAGKLVLSPTRTYAPFMIPLLQNFREHIHALIHCTGGAQTKILHFAPTVRIVKDNLFDPPPLFKMIKEESQTDWKEMYQVFNMGHRLEIVVEPSLADEIRSLATEFGIESRIIGHVESSAEKHLIIENREGRFEYGPDK